MPESAKPFILPTTSSFKSPCGDSRRDKPLRTGGVFFLTGVLQPHCRQQRGLTYRPCVKQGPSPHPSIPVQLTLFEALRTDQYHSSYQLQRTGTGSTSGSFLSGLLCSQCCTYGIRLFHFPGVECRLQINPRCCGHCASCGPFWSTLSISVQQQLPVSLSLI